MKISLKNFIDLSNQESDLIFTWRNDKRVANFMKTKNITKEQHKSFLASLKSDSSKAYFLVFENEIPIGVIDFVEISKDSCFFGIYQNPNLKGYGRILLKEVLNYAFNVLKLKSLNAHVFKDNTKAIALYKEFDFKHIKDENNMHHYELKLSL